MANIEDVSHLLKVMKQLRDPVRGCAWDLEQDHSSLIPYLEEESQVLNMEIPFVLMKKVLSGLKLT